MLINMSASTRLTPSPRMNWEPTGTGPWKYVIPFPLISVTIIYDVAPSAVGGPPLESAQVNFNNWSLSLWLQSPPLYNIVSCKGRSKHGSTPNVGLSHDCPAALDEPAITQVVPISRTHGAGATGKYTGTGAAGTGTGAIG